MSGEFRHIVRVAGADLEGTKRLEFGLAKVKGININLSRAIIKTANLESNQRIGYLTDVDTQKIEEILKGPEKNGIPGWLLNRCKDLATGKDLHVIGSELSLSVMSDIEFMKQIRSWKGLRHSYGLKVRGQKTKTTGRTGRIVGVAKKKLIAAAKASAEKKNKGDLEWAIQKDSERNMKRRNTLTLIQL